MNDELKAAQELVAQAAANVTEARRLLDLRNRSENVEVLSLVLTDLDVVWDSLRYKEGTP